MIMIINNTNFNNTKPIIPIIKPIIIVITY